MTDNELQDWRYKQASERVARMTDEEIQFGSCCPVEPCVARAILIDKFYQDIVDEGLAPD